MAETLAEAHRRLYTTLEPSERARKLAPMLREEVRELRFRVSTTKSAAEKELLELAVVRIEDAVELLRILEQEQWRQREAAKLHLHGRYDRAELRHVTETWNESHA